MDLNVPTIPVEFYLAASSVMVLCIGALINIMQSVFPSIGSPRAVYGVTMSCLLIALAASIVATPGVETAYLSGTYLAGRFTMVGQALILISAITVTMLMWGSYLKEKVGSGELAGIFQLVVAGMLIMVATEDLITIFVGLELSSIGLYALVGYYAPSRRSQEGAVKYFVLGSFAAAILLFGFALIYASTGTMRLTEIASAIAQYSDHHWLQLGVMLVIVGLAFKLAMAPFHMWVPDAYEAAPTGITAIMATAGKIMVMMVALRMFSGGMSAMFEVYLPSMMFVAAVSMIIGNIMALVQASLKRMLAYSSIAHSGYMAIAICAIGGGAGEFPVAAILFYLVGYTIASIGAFGIIMWLESADRDNLTLDDVTGLSKRHPWAAAGLCIFLFSFAGMPPTAGFIGKFFVFNAALASQLYAIVIIGVVGSTISLYYYLRVMVRMYFHDPVDGLAVTAPSRSWVYTGVLVGSVALIFLLTTILPAPVMELMIQKSSEVVSH